MTTILAAVKAHRDRGDLTAALDLLQEALATHGGDAELLFAFAGLLRDLDLNAEAVAIYRELHAALPDALPILHNLANALIAMGAGAEAARLLLGRVRRDPGDPLGWRTLGDALAVPDLEAACTAFRAAVALAPQEAPTYVNFAEALIDAGRFDAAAALLGRATALRPGDDAIAYNLACVHLARGAFATGLRAFEGRLGEHSPNRVVRALTMPRWDGGTLADRHIFILAEQGIGDQLWWSVFVRHVMEEARAATIEVSPKLLPLFTAAFPQARVIPLDAAREGRHWVAAGESRTGPHPADVYCEMGSLPLFRWSQVLDARRTAGLRPDPECVRTWADRLRMRTATPRVGVCWRSHVTHKGRHREYISLSELAPVLRALDATFVSLQVGDTEAEIADLWQADGLHVATMPDLDLFDDIAGAAALIANLDAVVTTATWIARLATALGVPTLILGNTPWMAQIDGREPAYPMARTLYPTPDRPWPQGVISRAVDEAPALLDGRWGQYKIDDGRIP